MRYRIYLAFILIFAICALASFDMPKGWIAGGTRPNDYEMGVDPGSGQNGKNAATIRSIKKETYGYGTMIQQFSAEKYKGKRLKLSGYLKTRAVDQWAGLLMKVIGKRANPVTGKEVNQIIALDNMYNRFVAGNTDFTMYDIVLDIPDSASSICIGARLNGAGQIWFEGLKVAYQS